MTINTSDIRLKILTLKHKSHQLLLEFLARPDAKIYLKVGGIAAIFLLFIILSTISYWTFSIIAYYRDPIGHLQDYYDPETPRYIDTMDFRTPQEKVLDKKAYEEELFQLNEFNTLLSDKIPINRKNKDPRSESCRMLSRTYMTDYNAVSASVIIVMYNEELSTLLRTIVSILLNSPMESIKEVIIIDDKSDRYELGARLDSEISQFPFVKLIRNKKREGLIRSRIIGSKAAEGKILIFLDSHVEVCEGWYKPIVERVLEDPKTVVCPVIAAIDHTSLELISDKYTSLWGAWDWDMVYKWRPIPPREMQRRGFDESKPIRTPAMAGGLFGINRDFFFEIGAYDPGMKIWGGENLEMSFRIWMCGGAIEINTCSYVGHIFRRGSVIAKTVTGETVLQQNTKRAVEVWLDEYKDVHYKAVPSNKDVEAGDFVSRTLLRQRLKCRSFSWYLREVFPDQLRPNRDFIAYGEVKGPGDQCLDTLGPGVGHQAGVWSCHGKGNNQFWKFLLSGMIVNDNYCLDGDGENPRRVVMYDCHGLGGNQQWFLTEDGDIKHGGSGKCLSHDGRHLILLPCDFNDDRFKWKFTGMTPELLQKFYVLHSKQFGYITKKDKEAKREAQRKRNEEIAARKKEAQEKREREKQEEGLKKREEKEKKEREERERKEKERMDKEREESELREWREEKKKLENQKRAAQEDKKLAEEQRLKELEEMKKEKEKREKIKLEEAKREKELREKEKNDKEEQERLRKEKQEKERIENETLEKERLEKQITKKEIDEKENELKKIHQEDEEAYAKVDNDDRKEESDDKKNDIKNEDDDMKEFLAWKAAQKKKTE